MFNGNFEGKQATTNKKNFLYPEKFESIGKLFLPGHNHSVGINLQISCSGFLIAKLNKYFFMLLSKNLKVFE